MIYRAKKDISFRRRSGQSLVEILVGLGIGSILIGGAVLALSGFIRSHTSLDQSQQVFTSGEELFQRLQSFIPGAWADFFSLQKGLTKYYFLSPATSTFRVVQGQESVLDNDTTFGLVGRWGFDEEKTSTSTTTYDMSGYVNDGILTNTPSRISGCVIGNCISFNNSANNYYIDISNESWFDFANSFSLSLWVRPQNFSSTYRALIGKYQSNSGWDLGIGTNGKIRMTLRGSSMIDVSQGAGPFLKDNQWHHVVVVNTTSSITTYVDGVLVGVTPGVWSPTTNNVTLKLGNRESNATTAYMGDMDEVRIYNRALSSQEVRRLYQSGVSFRSFSIQDVCRNSFGEIATTTDDLGNCIGYFKDPSTMKITVHGVSRVGSSPLEFTHYLTRFTNAAFRQNAWSGGIGGEVVGDLPNIFSSSSQIDFSQGGLKIQGLQ